VALSQKHRIALYEHFVPALGEDVTEAFLAELPSHDGDELVTKDFLRAELAEQIGSVRAELAEQIGSVRAELAEQIGSVRAELAEQIGSVRTDTGSLRAEMQRLHNQTLTTIIGVAGVMTAVLAIFN